MDHRPTIVAPASGQGKAGVAVIRVSGPGARAAVEAVAGPIPRPRLAALRAFVDPRDGEPIDRGLLLWFPGPASFTGEDMAELHVHGGRSVVAAMLRILIACGCRMAEPGEFARRAFANGKLDLAAAEGLADLIDAETDAQRRQALRQLDGALGRKVESWSAALLEATAWAEAALDFSDESDVPARSLASALESVAPVLAEMDEALAQGDRGERLRDGFMVVLAGAPNAGKSSLLNALARRDAAIVSPLPGTTRDAIEVRLDLGGLPITLTDLAGIRDSSDPIEREGVARAKRHMARADLILWLSAADEPPGRPDSAGSPVVLLRSKADLAAATDSSAEPWQGFINLSVATGEGVDTVLSRIEEEARGRLGGGDALITRERHRRALEDARDHLARALEAANGGEELVAEDLRLALRALGRITGKVDVEDVLGAIFSRFCIGK